MSVGWLVGWSVGWSVRHAPVIAGNVQNHTRTNHYSLFTIHVRLGRIELGIGLTELGMGQRIHVSSHFTPYHNTY